MADQEKKVKHEKTAINKANTGPVVNYLTLLMVAGFFLLVMTFLMEQRESAEVLDGLRNSVSAMQSVENLYDENANLTVENNLLQAEKEALEETCISLEETAQILTSNLEEKENQVLALDYFWQITEAFTLGKEDIVLEYVEMMESSQLVQFLPQKNQSDTGALSPAERYAEILGTLDMGD